MAIQRLDNISAAVQAISDVIRQHGASIPDNVYSTLSALYPSPVDRIVDCAEAAYAGAKLGSVAAPLATVACQLATMCTEYMWHDIGKTDRGVKMALACRRICGEEVSQLEADDPAIEPRYSPVVVTEEPE